LGIDANTPFQSRDLSSVCVKLTVPVNIGLVVSVGMVEGGRPLRPGWRRAAISAAITTGLAVVLLSPFALLVLDRLSERDWQRLSAIGQTYGAVSALLAAAALAGVMISLVQQRRSAQVDREHVFRSVNLELTRMLLDHPDLLRSYDSRLGATTSSEQRINLYCNQLVLAMQMGYEIGSLDEHAVVITAREIFGSDHSRSWWSRVRQTKLQEARNKEERRLMTLIDDVWRWSSVGLATSSSPPGSGTIAAAENGETDSVTSRDRHGVLRSVVGEDPSRTIALVSLLAGGVAIAVARSSVRRSNRSSRQLS
jgi:hypothetical protein